MHTYRHMSLRTWADEMKQRIDMTCGLLFVSSLGLPAASPTDTSRGEMWCYRTARHACKVANQEVQASHESSQLLRISTLTPPNDFTFISLTWPVRRAEQAGHQGLPALTCCASLFGCVPFSLHLPTLHS